MDLIFQQQTTTLNTPTSDEVIKQINNILKKDYFFSHFIANGIEIYEKHEEYLDNHINEIKQLVIIAKTVKEFVNDILLAAEEYLERAMPELTPLSEAFYDNPTSEAWSKLDQLLAGIQWINEMLMSIGTSGELPCNWTGYLSVSKKIDLEIENLAVSMENEDHVLVGDIILYELFPVFEQLDKEIKHTMDNEGRRHDLS
ncbi:hypothetical protein [Sporosarcina cyprini]|uniref:hypothetical protein n=1 Tax=Sporosarcina cyprini TaxID=2910523 RepID=UPI001EE089A6|nr:hypothetical protein [Sporosarcina cyprini]MCG3089599.1 hypothetical protein [Sporosarcina cyprini]